MPWIVTLLRKPKVNDFRADFFPRRFAYKRDAQELAREVKEKGGEAMVAKAKK